MTRQEQNLQIGKYGSFNRPLRLFWCRNQYWRNCIFQHISGQKGSRKAVNFANPAVWGKAKSFNLSGIRWHFKNRVTGWCDFYRLEIFIVMKLQALWDWRTTASNSIWLELLQGPVISFSNLIDDSRITTSDVLSKNTEICSHVASWKVSGEIARQIYYDCRDDDIQNQINWQER